MTDRLAAAWRIRYGRWCASHFTDAVTVLCLLARFRQNPELNPWKFTLERKP